MSFAKDIAKFAKSLNKVVKQAESQGTLVNLAAVAIDVIQRRTWSGKGVKKTGGSTFRLKPLSKNYIKFRRKNANRLSGMTSPAKSNLTFTGQMLYSLGLKKATKRLTIEPQGTRVDGKTNAEVARHVSKVRPFLALSKEELGVVEKFFRKTFDDIVNRNV